MKTFTLMVALAFAATPAAAQDPNTLTAAEKEAGWKLLFDGKTVEGWNSWRGRKPLEAGVWAVKDGALTLTGKGGGDIYTAKAYENYEFSLEFKAQGNSGILLRVDPASKGPIYGVAPEIQVNRDNPKAKNSTSTGGLYALYDIEGEKVFHPDGWNEVRVKLVNGHGTTWLNGKKLYEYQIGSDDWKARVAKSKFKKVVDKFGMTAKGHIGLQDHGNVVAYRNLKIRELPAKP